MGAMTSLAGDSCKVAGFVGQQQGALGQSIDSVVCPAKLTVVLFEPLRTFLYLATAA
jgi:hypothetical protein